MDNLKLSIIASQIGYRPADKKLAVIRSEKLTADILNNCEIRVISTQQNQIAYSSKEIQYWGEKWGIQFWIFEFSGLNEEGEYFLELCSESVILKSSHFRIADKIFKDTTLLKTSIGQLDQKTGDKLGWQDCGSDLRAVEGHAVQLLGLIDCYEVFSNSMDVLEKSKFMEHIKRGSDYLLVCQKDDGYFINEFYSNEDKKSWILSLMATIALSRAYEVTDNVSYLNSAKKGWDFCIEKMCYSRNELLQELDDTRKIFGKYSPWIPPSGLRARDKVLIVWAGTELYKNTNDVKYKNAAILHADNIADKLQFLDYKSLDGIYGNFYAWEDSGIHQKSWEHFGWGYNCGAVLPDELSGFVNLIAMFPGEESWTKWRYTLRQYAIGFLKRASLLTPFRIYPLGIFEGEVRFFGPSWHGFNGMYGRIARISMMLARILEDPDYEFIAVQNMQWVAGLNTGIEREGAYEGVCFINGTGTSNAGSWTNIEGSISNGFCANPQFKLIHMDDCDDGPKYLTNEDWIVHNGGWLSGLSQIEQSCNIKIKTLYKGRPVQAEVRIFMPEEHDYTTNHRGLLRLESLPSMRKVTIQLNWGGVKVESSFSTISGLNKVIVIDFSDHLESHACVDSKNKKCTLYVTNLGRDKTFVDVFLRPEAIKISKHEFRNEVGSGQTAEFQFDYCNADETIIKPFYIYAEIAGNYSNSICEIDWQE